MKGLLRNWAVFGIVLCLSTAAFGLNLQVTPSNFYFTAYESGENPAAQTLTIKNDASAPVTWQITNVNELSLSLPEWLSIDLVSGTLDPNGMPDDSQEVVISATTGSLTKTWDPYSFYFDIVAGGTERHTVHVEFVIIGPRIGLSWNQLNLTMLVHSSNPEPNEIIISNTAGGTLNWVLNTSTLPEWLSITPIEGSLGIGQSQPLVLSYDADELPIGHYSYQCRVDGAPGSVPAYFKVHLDVVGPRLSLSDNYLNFSCTVPGSNPPAQNLIVENAGSGVLNWAIAMPGKPDWLTTAPLSGSLLPGQTDTVTLSVDTSGLTEGGYAYAFTISAPDSSGSPQTVNIDLVLDFSTYDWSTNPGTGEANNPYQISTPVQLASIGADPVLVTKHYMLLNDIDMSAYHGTYYTPIGDYTTQFTGSFDGNGHVIRHLSYTTAAATSYVGLFGAVHNAEIKNLGVENVFISCGGGPVGGLIGASFTSTVTDCYVTGSVTGNVTVGGLIGGNSGNVSSCYMTGSVNGSQNVGGLIGSNYGSIYACEAVCSIHTSGNSIGGLVGFNVNEGILVDCHAAGSVSGGNRIGGLIGETNGSGKIENCSASSNVTGSSYLGGLCGRISVTYSRGIIHCFATGSVSGADNAGGLVGYALSSEVITNCYATGSVQTTGMYAGGLIGRRTGTNNGQGKVNYCYATGSVKTAGDYAGGLIGSTESTSVSFCCASGSVEGRNCVGGLIGVGGYATACYATGPVSGNVDVGGLVGYGWSMNACYATGRVEGSNTVGGLVGLVQGGGFSDCFWDTQTTGMTIGAGFGGSTGITGIATAAMMTQSPFTLKGWDFSGSDGDAADWMMLREGEDYPRLAWQEIYPGDIAGLYGVDLVDLMELAANWLRQDCPVNCEQADIDQSGKVDLSDLAILAFDWLR